MVQPILKDFFDTDHPSIGQQMKAPSCIQLRKPPALAEQFGPRCNLDFGIVALIPKYPPEVSIIRGRLLVKKIMFCA
ncbi:MAG: hypothetical protein H0W62_07880 [Chitinophagales bacterium]|nr:hypothetical protein [Chitinophagales bacterium]